MDANAKRSVDDDIGNGRRVLVVDDHEDSCELLQTVLSDAGHAVTVARDGEAGLAALLAGHYHVAIIDVGLPRLDGYELVRRARRVLGARTPKLVATTGYAAQSDREEALQAGFDIHLAKPVEIAALLAVVRLQDCRAAPTPQLG